MNENKVYTALGLMSGTSLDGIDIAVIETDGADHVRSLYFKTMPYAPEDRAVIRAAYGRTERNDPVVQAAADLSTSLHIAAVQAVQKKHSVDLIGYHGQTIFHAPERKLTIQLGDGPCMAKETGVETVYDFRAADVAAGGQGAPLTPLYHRALLQASGVELPAAVLNIGGVGNVTWVGFEENDILAFDTGPGNALLDDWMQRRTGKAFDEGGATASRGAIRRDLLDLWLSHEYFLRTPPKSLDRDEWDIAVLGPLVENMEMISTEDGAATLAAFSAQSIIRSAQFMPAAPKAWFVCGGGAHNAFIMNMLRDALPAVKPISAIGVNGDAVEAECFAYLAVRSLLGLPISLPATTSAPEPLTGGVLAKVQ